MEKRVLNFKSMNSNTLKGTFDLEIGDLIVKGWTLHEKNGKQWTNPPSREYLKDDNTKGYSPIVWFPDKPQYYEFQKWALSEIAKLKEVDSKAKNFLDEIPF